MLSTVDWIIIGIVAVWLILAVIYLIRAKKKGKSCCSGCTSCQKCSGDCSSCQACSDKKKRM